MAASRESADHMRDGETEMDDSGDQQIVPGISVSRSGQATVDPGLADVLFDLAIQLEDAVQLPVDVEHVLAAIVLAAHNGELDQSTAISSNDSLLQSLLADHVRTVFEKYDGRVGMDDE